MTMIPELDHPEGRGPPLYWKLVAALERLLEDEPTSGILLAAREEADEDGKTHPVVITQKHVALEAGKLYLRKHISGTDCTFPRLAAYILSLRSTHGVVENTTRKIERQASDIAILDQKVRMLRSQVLDAIAAKQAAESALQDAEAIIARLRRHQAA